MGHLSTVMCHESMSHGSMIHDSWVIGKYSHFRFRQSWAMVHISIVTGHGPKVIGNGICGMGHVQTVSLALDTGSMGCSLLLLCPGLNVMGHWALVIAVGIYLDTWISYFFAGLHDFILHQDYDYNF